MTIDTDERHHTEQLRNAYLKRLRVLELREARSGPDTEPYIATEISDLQNKIDELDRRLSDLQKNDINEVLDAKQRRLRVLELKAATIGAEAPPEILTEIESLRDEIDSALKSIDFSKTSRRSTTEVELVIKGNFDNLTPEVMNATVRAIAALMDITPDKVRIMRVFEG